METIAVIHEDKDFLILNKPAGLLVHGISAKRDSLASVHMSVADWLRANYPETKSVGDDPERRPGIVHRLDRDTSGVLAVARTQGAFSHLKRLFQKREVMKAYVALVWGKVEPREGAVRAPIGLKSGTTRRTVAVGRAKKVQEAETRYRVLRRFTFRGENFTLLTVRPITGRTHQIRVHLASIGHPVLGDAFYGGKRKRAKAEEFGVSRQFLHAESVEFTSRSGERIMACADLPSDLERVLAQFSAGRAVPHLHS